MSVYTLYFLMPFLPYFLHVMQVRENYYNLHHALYNEAMSQECKKRRKIKKNATECKDFLSVAKKTTFSVYILKCGKNN